MSINKSQIIVFVVVFTMSLSIFMLIRQAQTDPRDFATGEPDPRVIVEDITFYGYRGPEVEQTFSAQVGQYIEPNIVEFYAQVRGTRYKDDRLQSLRCENVKGILDASSLGEVMSNSEVKLLRAEVDNDVRVGIGEDVLRTEHAEYFAQSNLVTSREPVDMVGPNRNLSGDQGFEYDLKGENLWLKGKVQGLVQPKEEGL